MSTKLKLNKRDSALIQALPKYQQEVFEKAGHVQRGELLAKLADGFSFAEIGSWGTFYLRKGASFMTASDHCWILTDGTVCP